MEVSAEGRPIRLGGRQQQLLLALLLLHANKVVSEDLLVDAIWSETPPPSATNVLHVYVSRLRKVLPAANGTGRLVTRPPGYTLAVEPGELDAALFEQLLGDGKRALAAGEPEAASARLSEALALWRGPPLAEFALVDVAQRESARLDELRMEALENRIEADFACGRHAHLVGDLGALVSEHPLRERLRRQQMLALYRSGRQAEALQAYQDARRTFVDELGIEPTPALKQLHQRMLRQDPSLEPERAPQRATGETSAGRPVARRRIALWTAIALLAAGLAAATAIIAGHSSARPNAAPNIGPVSSGLAVALDPATRRVLGRIRVTSPTALVTGGGAVWITSYYGRTVLRVDPRTHEVIDTIGVSGRPNDTAFAGGALWVLSNTARRLWRIDPRTDSVTDSIPIRSLAPPWIERLALGPVAVAAGAGAIWVSDPPTTVLRIDPSSRRVVARVRFLDPPRALAAGDEAVWVGHSDGTLSRIDPQTNVVDATAQTGSAELGHIATAAHSVWVASPSADQVWRIDPFARRARGVVSVAGFPNGLAAGDSIWVASERAGAIVEIDPATNRVAQRIVVGGAPVALALSRRELWVALDSPAGAERFSFTGP